MISEIGHRREEIAALCSKYRVRKLELFGSAATDHFDPAKSDLDSLVVFEPIAPVEHADCYFGLLEELQNAFRDNIDLVELSAVRNPYFLKGIRNSRVVIYAS